MVWRFLSRPFAKEPPFFKLVQDFDVVIMKHCYPASDVIEDAGRPDPSSPSQSSENYKAIYRLLREKFDQYPDTLLIVWTLPPRHRLFEPLRGDKHANAARATEYSNWLKKEYLTERGCHPNISIWDFREIVMNPNTNFLKYEYECNHNRPDSHPNNTANNDSGPQFAQFIVDTIANSYSSAKVEKGVKIVFLHHSTGFNVYKYPDLGIAAFINKYNATTGTNYLISHKWYPSEGNMPVHYYQRWLAPVGIESQHP